METGAYIAGGVSVACVIALFVMGNRLVRIGLAIMVLLVLGGFALFMAYASGLLAYLLR